MPQVDIHSNVLVTIGLCLEIEGFVAEFFRKNWSFEQLKNQ
jgi:hypothetical protein